MQDANKFVLEDFDHSDIKDDSNVNFILTTYTPIYATKSLDCESSDDVIIFLHTVAVPCVVEHASQARIVIQQNILVLNWQAITDLSTRKSSAKYTRQHFGKAMHNEKFKKLNKLSHSK